MSNPQYTTSGNHSAHSVLSILFNIPLGPSDFLPRWSPRNHFPSPHLPSYSLPLGLAVYLSPPDLSISYLPPRVSFYLSSRSLLPSSFSASLSLPLSPVQHTNTPTRAARTWACAAGCCRGPRVDMHVTNTPTRRDTRNSRHDGCGVWRTHGAERVRATGQSRVHTTAFRTHALRSPAIDRPPASPVPRSPPASGSSTPRNRADIADRPTRARNFQGSVANGSKFRR